jgi:hypothetical protein
MNYSTNSVNRNKFISNKRERIKSDISLNTINEDENSPIVVLKPNTKYPDSNFKTVRENIGIRKSFNLNLLNR